MGGRSRAAYSGGSSDQGGGGNRWSSFQVKSSCCIFIIRTDKNQHSIFLRAIEVVRAQRAAREVREATLDRGVAVAS